MTEKYRQQEHLNLLLVFMKILMVRFICNSHGYWDIYWWTFRDLCKAASNNFSQQSLSSEKIFITKIAYWKRTVSEWYSNKNKVVITGHFYKDNYTGRLTIKVD